MTKILVVGDCHVDETQSLERFNWLGKLIVDERPDHIVYMGDFLTLNCLSAWDLNKRAKMEGRRYAVEVGVGRFALGMAEAPMRKLQIRQRANHEKLYKPELVFIEGNHEDRLTRYLEKDPTFAGHISIEKDLSLFARGYKFIPYREYHYINNIAFTHIPFNKIREISGANITMKASQCIVDSVVFGHTHEQHLAHIHRQGMPHLQDIYNCGCFISKKEDYVHGRVTQYWRGVSFLHTEDPGRFDVETVSYSALRRRYGGSK